jgi:hypothetical protein
MKNVVITLNPGMGSNLGPIFTLSANVGSVTPSSVILSDLETGYNVSIEDGATDVIITSTGECTNSLTVSLTTTSSTTSSTTTQQSS